MSFKFLVSTELVFGQLSGACEIPSWYCVLIYDADTTVRLSTIALTHWLVC